MTDIPTGKNTHVSQADGAPGSASASPAPSAAAPPPQAAEEHLYRASLTWKGDGTGCGEAYVAHESFAIPIGSAKELGGCGEGANSEEMMLAAVGTCWIGTWAIFLKKLAVPYDDPRIALTCSIGKDPAGGFRMTGMRIYAKVPASLLAEHRAAIAKTIQLAEKYCIMSKVARAAMPVEAVVEEI